MDGDNKTVLDSEETVYDSAETLPDATVPDTAVPDAVGTILDGTSTVLDMGDVKTGGSATALEIGNTILDTYRVESKPIEGGMGKVWRVHHTGWNTDLAMKQPKAELFITEKHKGNFVSECESWINLGLHPHIVSCYYVREICGIPTIFSEWMDGGSLKNIIKDGSLYSNKQEERILDIAIQFARGLHFSHENRLIHQDVKPDNLLLTKEGEAKVADFGIAKARAGLTSHAVDTLYDGTMFSKKGGYTQAYCSLEQKNEKNITRRTDIYSWAVSVMEMYLGERLWEDGVIAGMACESYFPEARVTVPEAMQVLLKECMNADEAQRPHDFSVVEERLLNIYKGILGREYPRLSGKAASDTADSLNNRALSYLELGKAKDAEACWEKAGLFDAENSNVLYNRILHEWSSGCISDREAIERWRQFISSGFLVQRHYLLAQMLIFCGKGSEALKILKDILEDTKTNSNMTNIHVTVSDIENTIKTAEQIAVKEMAGCHFSADSKEVKGLSINSNGDLLASYGRDNEAKVWNIKDGTLRAGLAGHTEKLDGACFAGNKNEILTCDWFLNCIHWNADTGKQLENETWDPRQVSSIYHSPYLSYVLVHLRSGRVKTYDAETQSFLCDFEDLRSIKNMCFCPDGEHAVIYDEEKNLHLFSLRDGHMIRVFDIKKSEHINYGLSADISKTVFCNEAVENLEVTGIAVSLDNSLMVTCLNDASPVLWDIAGGESIIGFEQHAKSLFAAFHPKGRYIVLYGTWAKIMDIQTGCCIRTYYEDSVYCNSAVFSKNGDTLILGKSDGTIQTCDTSFLNIPHRLTWSLSRIKTFYQTMDSQERFLELLQSAEDNLSQGNIMEALNKIHAMRNVEGYLTSPQWMDIAFRTGKHCEKAGLDSLIFTGALDQVLSRYPVATDGKFIAGGIGKGVIRVWDACSLKPLYDVDKHSHGITALSFDGYGCMASASYDKTIRLWQAATGLCINTFKGHTTDVYCIDLTKGGRYIASGALAGNDKNDCTLFVWDTISGKAIHTFKQCVETIEKCIILEDCKSVYALESTGRLLFWNVNNDDPVQLSQQASDFTISQDKRHLVICGKDGVNYLWDIHSYELLNSWTAFSEGSISVCFSQNGTLLFSGDKDKNIRVWDVFTGQQINQFSIDKSSEYYSLKLITSPDERFMITIGHEDMPKVWYIDWIYKERRK